MSAALTYLACELVVLLAAGRPPRAQATSKQQKPQLTLVKPTTEVGPGRVRYVTTELVYIDRGSADGVALNDRIGVVRGAKTEPGCEVVQLGEHSAVCKGAGLRVGDRVLAVRKAVERPLPLQPLPSPDELTAERLALDAQPWPLVEASQSGPAARADGSRLRISLSHRTFLDVAGRDFELEQLDALVHQRIADGLMVSADASLLVWSKRPSGSRNPRTTIVQPFVRQLEVAWLPSTVPLVVRAGRVRLRFVPGMVAVDGAQVGYRTEDREVGAYGGLLPDAITTAFATTQFALGAYGMNRWAWSLGPTAKVVQTEARAGWAVRPNLGSRFEAGLSAHGWFNRALDAHASALFSIGAAQTSAAAVDLATLDLGITPSEVFRAHLSARYRGNALLEALSAGVVLPVTRSVHASADASFDLSPSLTIAARGGVSAELLGQLTQGNVGPELFFRAWQGRVGVGASYQEDFGWLRGRSFSLSASLATSAAFRIQARASWFQQPTPSLGAHELSGALNVDARLTSFLVARLSGSWRSGLSGPQATPLLARSAAQGMFALVFER